jgi:LysR family transcriptional regulator, glycine cleavage system transcriptional activator
MYRDLPPLTWLRAFEVSARLLSFTAAAQELHLTQAAVSKHVKSLEQRVQRQLFLRHPRSLELTKWGEAYLPKVQDALERLAIGTREVFGRPQGDLLTIRCAVSFAVNWLSPRLPRFLAQHPSSRLRILSSVWAEPFDAEACDLDIQYGTGTFADARCHRLTGSVTEPSSPLSTREAAAETLGSQVASTPPSRPDALARGPGKGGSALNRRAGGRQPFAHRAQGHSHGSACTGGGGSK